MLLHPNRGYVSSQLRLRHTNAEGADGGGECGFCMAVVVTSFFEKDRGGEMRGIGNSGEISQN